MYIILQFCSFWSIYDNETGENRLLEKKEISSLEIQFHNLLGTGILNVMQLQKINPNRLLKMPSTGYVIVRVGEMWTMYEGGKPAPKILDKNAIAGLMATFPKLIDQQLLNAISIDSFNPVKLLNLSLPLQVPRNAAQGSGADLLAIEQP